MKNWMKNRHCLVSICLTVVGVTLGACSGATSDGSSATTTERAAPVASEAAPSGRAGNDTVVDARPQAAGVLRRRSDTPMSRDTSLRPSAVPTPPSKPEIITDRELAEPPIAKPFHAAATQSVAVVTPETLAKQADYLKRLEALRPSLTTLSPVEQERQKAALKQATMGDGS